MANMQESIVIHIEPNPDVLLGAALCYEAHRDGSKRRKVECCRAAVQSSGILRELIVTAHGCPFTTTLPIRLGVFRAWNDFSWSHLAKHKKFSIQELCDVVQVCAVQRESALL